MEETATRRGSRDTRAAILRAARDVLWVSGGFVSLEEIIEKAGVSKGGLLYHFPTKDAVMVGVAGFTVAAWRSGVMALVDAGEPVRGRVLRAYVRACFDTDLGANRVVLSRSAMLGPRSRIESLARADADHWRGVLAQDGISEDIRLTVTAAADAAAVTPFAHMTMSGRERRHLRRFLLATIDSHTARGRPGVSETPY